MLISLSSPKKKKTHWKGKRENDQPTQLNPWGCQTLQALAFSSLQLLVVSLTLPFEAPTTYAIPPGSFQIWLWVAKAPYLGTKTGYQRWGPRQQGMGQGPCSLFHPLLPIPSCALPVKLFGLLSAKLLCVGCLVTQEPKQIVIPNFPWTPKGQCDTFKHHTVFASNKYVNAPWFVSFPGLTFGKCSPEMAGLSFSNPAWYISTKGLSTF